MPSQLPVSVFIRVALILAVAAAGPVLYEDQTFGSSLVIADDVESVVIRRCNIGTILRIGGAAVQFAVLPPMELTILIEDCTIGTDINLRYLNLHGNSSITVRNTVVTKAVDIFDLVLNAVPILFENVRQRNFWYREIIMRKSTFLGERLQLPMIGAGLLDDYEGELRLTKVDAQEESVVVFDQLVGSHMITATNIFRTSNLTFSNSVFIADPVCEKTNCDFNLSVAANNAVVNISNCSFLNNTIRIEDFPYTNRSLLLIDRVTVIHYETSTKRGAYGFLSTGAADFTEQSILSFVDTTIHVLHGVQDTANRLTTSRPVSVNGDVRNSTLSFQRCDFFGEYDPDRTSKNIYAGGIYSARFAAESVLSVDLATYNALRGSISFNLLDSLAHELDLSGIQNSKLDMYFRGALKQSVRVVGAKFDTITFHSVQMEGSSRGIFIDDSNIRIITLATSATFSAGAQLAIRNSNVRSLLNFASLHVEQGAALIDNTTVGKWEWDSGKVSERSSVLFLRCSCGNVIFTHDVQSGSQMILQDSVFDGNIVVNSMAVTDGSMLMVRNATIDVQSVSATATQAIGLFVRSVRVVDSSLIMNGNKISALRTNTGFPTPFDLAIGIFLEGTVEVSGSSSVWYYGNIVTTSQNGGSGTSVRHDAVMRTGMPLIYTPGEGSGGPGGDVVSITLYEEATLDIDWCSMWDVAVLYLAFVNPTRPMVLDGIDARKVGSLVLSCGGGAGAMPMLISNSRFASLTIGQCVVNETSPFVMEDSLVEGVFTWGQTSVSSPPAAILFNVTVVGGLTNLDPAMIGPSNVRRPPVVQETLLRSGLGNSTRWNNERCFPDAPPFSWTPSVSVSTTDSSTPSPASTATPSTSSTPTATSSNTRSGGSLSASLQPTPTIGATPSNHGVTATRSQVNDEQHSITSSMTESSSQRPSSKTASLAQVAQHTATPTVVPLPTAAPPPQPSVRPSTKTVTLCPVVPPFEFAKEDTTQETTERGPYVFVLRPGPQLLAASSVCASSSCSSTQAIAPRHMRVRWWRAAKDLPSGLSIEGALPAASLQVAAVINAAGVSSLTVTVDLSVATDAFQFGDGFPIGLEVAVRPSFFAETLCDDENVALGVLNIEPTPTPFLDATRGLAQTAGDVSAVASVIGGAGAGDATSLAIMAEMGCSRPVLKEGGRNQLLLSPAAFDNSLSGMLHGSILLFFVIPVVHIAATVGYGAKVGALQAAPLLAMAFTRFPSWTFGSLAMLHQGLTYVSLRLLVTDGVDEVSGSNSVAAAGFGFFLVLIVPPAFVFIAARFIDATYVEYDFAATPTPPSKFWQRVLPRGRWETAETRTAFGVLLAPFQKQHPMWAAFQFASPSLVAVVAAARPDSSEGCSYQYGWLAALVGLYGIALYKVRPYRAAILNGLAGVSTASLFGIASISLLQTLAGGSSPATIVLLLILIYLQMFCTFARVGYIVFNMIFEGKHTEGVVMIPVLRRVPPKNWCSCDFSDDGGKPLPKVYVPDAPLQPDGTRKKKKKTEELEVPLLKVHATKNGGRDGGAVNLYDPAIQAGGHIIDLAMLEDMEALLEEKALPDHMLNEALRRSSLLSGGGGDQNTLSRLVAEQNHQRGHRKSNVLGVSFDDIANVVPAADPGTELLRSSDEFDDPLRMTSDDVPPSGSRGSIFAIPPFDPTEAVAGGGLLQVPMQQLRRRSSAWNRSAADTEGGARNSERLDSLSMLMADLPDAAPAKPANPLLMGAMPGSQSPRHSVVVPTSQSPSPSITHAVPISGSPRPSLAGLVPPSLLQQSETSGLPTRPFRTGEGSLSI